MMGQRYKRVIPDDQLPSLPVWLWAVMLLTLIAALCDEFLLK
jgi:hypothetical protein